HYYLCRQLKGGGMEIKMNFLICLFSIISISFAFQMKFKRTFAESVSVSVLSIIMLLYFFTLFLPLTYSAYIVCGIAVISCIYITIKLLLYRNQICIHYFISFPFFLFILCSLFAWMAFRRRMAIEWDEFSHWMLVVKNMYIFKNFGVGEGTTTQFTGYPPAVGLFECFFSIFSSAFSEGKTYIGLNILLLSLLISPLKNIGNNLKKSFFTLWVLLSAPLLFYSAYNSLYVDCILGIMFARLVYIGFSEEKYDFFFFYNFAISSSVLILTKASGTGLYAFAFLIVLLDMLIFSRKYFADSSNKRAWGTAVLGMTVLPFAVKWSWDRYLAVHGLREAWDTSNVSVTGILELFTDKAPEYRFVTIRAFADAYFHMNEFGDIGFKCSYFLFPVIFTIIFSIICSMGEKKKRGMYLNGALWVSYILYSVSLLVLYLFTYTSVEAQVVASFPRYMNTITLGYFLTTVIFLLDPSVIHRDSVDERGLRIPLKSMNVAIMVITLFLTGIEAKNHVLFSIADAKEIQEKRVSYGHIVGLEGLFDYNTDKVYYIDEGSTGYNYWMTRYVLTPVSINPNFTWSLSNEPAEGDIWTMKITAQEWSDVLRDYTYVYLDTISEDFRKEYGALFADPSNILDKTIYKVINSGEENLVALIPYTKN
ncbi:MAG: hypothetical protein NC489_12965, partial [Ruminococcus flavefaciens]|nr:hypothetical protein [Ruminococcus flavefaciens]